MTPEQKDYYEKELAKIRRDGGSHDFGCMCGEPWQLETVHRKKTPCFHYIEREWVELTKDEMDKIETCGRRIHD